MPCIRLAARARLTACCCRDCFLLLTLAFRSLLVPAIGAIGNLLTIVVALGSTVALFQ